jgi:hypothetical protein
MKLPKALRCWKFEIGFVWVRFLDSQQSPVSSNQLWINCLQQFGLILNWVRLAKKGLRG